MPQLKCTVQTCVHNKQFLCDLDEITVGGESAKNPKETCCDSFQERKEGSYTNSMKEASDCSCVDCKATNCMYNKECECHAGKISVEGGDAKQASGTECATFQSCIADCLKHVLRVKQERKRTKQLFKITEKRKIIYPE